MLFDDRLFFFYWLRISYMYTMFDQGLPALYSLQLFLCPHHHSALPTPWIIFFLLNLQSPLDPAVCTWLTEKTRGRLLVNQRLRFKRLIWQTQMNRFSFSPLFKWTYIFIYVWVYSFVHTYLYMCIHVCGGQRLQPLPRHPGCCFTLRESLVFPS